VIRRRLSREVLPVRSVPRPKTPKGSLGRAKPTVRSMSSHSLVFGLPEEWNVFLKTHKEFLDRQASLVALLDRTFTREISVQRPADGVVFFMGRLCVEDFMEILLMCGNGYGIGAMKLLRAMYEQAVTMGYLAKHPEEADMFLNYSKIHAYKRLGHLQNEERAQFFSQSQIDDIRTNYESVKEIYTEMICKKCRKKRVQASWSKLDLLTMAREAELDGLYHSCYFEPTLQMHATDSSLIWRFEKREDGELGFDASAQRQWASTVLMLAHSLMIHVLLIQNKYFNLSIDEDLESRFQDFKEIWGKTPE